MVKYGSVNCIVRARYGSEASHKWQKPSQHAIFIYSRSVSWLFASPLLSLQDGVTPLITASNEGHTSVVKLLLEAKAEIDVQNKVMLAAVAYIICSVVAVVV